MYGYNVSTVMLYKQQYSEIHEVWKMGSKQEFSLVSPVNRTSV